MVLVFILLLAQLSPLTVNIHRSFLGRVQYFYINKTQQQQFQILLSGKVPRRRCLRVKDGTLPENSQGTRDNGERRADPGGLSHVPPNRPTGGIYSPGTTPLVAMALMEMAVSRVCRKEGLGEQLSGVGPAEPRAPRPAQLQPPPPTPRHSHSSSR